MRAAGPGEPEESLSRVAAGADQWSELRGAHGSYGLLYIPELLDEDPVRLVVLFHGATQPVESARRILEVQARDYGFALLVPRSAGRTWDAIRGPSGTDLRAADALIEAAAGRVPVSPGVIVAGFSDGASYALGAGVALDREVSGIIAFSPGFVAPVGRPVRKPRVFVSHGIGDPVLTIDLASRTIVPRLLAGGYDVWYREFPGGHTVPPEIADEAVDWMLAGPA